MLDYQNSSISSIQTDSYTTWNEQESIIKIKKPNTIDGTEQYVDKHTNRKQVNRLKTTHYQATQNNWRTVFICSNGQKFWKSKNHTWSITF